jgi:hypothetical protein
MKGETTDETYREKGQTARDDEGAGPPTAAVNKRL